MTSGGKLATILIIFLRINWPNLCIFLTGVRTHPTHLVCLCHWLVDKIVRVDCVRTRWLPASFSVRLCIVLVSLLSVEEMCAQVDKWVEVVKLPTAVTLVRSVTAVFHSVTSQRVWNTLDRRRRTLELVVGTRDETRRTSAWESSVDTHAEQRQQITPANTNTTNTTTTRQYTWRNTEYQCMRKFRWHTHWTTTTNTTPATSTTTTTTTTTTIY